MSLCWPLFSCSVLAGHFRAPKITLKNLYVITQRQAVSVLKETKAQLVRRKSDENIFLITKNFMITKMVLKKFFKTVFWLLQSLKCLSKSWRRYTALKTLLFCSSSLCLLGRGKSGACFRQAPRGLTNPAPVWFLQHPGSPGPAPVVGLGLGSHALFSSSWQIRCRAADLASPNTDATSYL